VNNSHKIQDSRLQPSCPITIQCSSSYPPFEHIHPITRFCVIWAPRIAGLGISSLKPKPCPCHDLAPFAQGSIVPAYLDITTSVYRPPPRRDIDNATAIYYSHRFCPLTQQLTNDERTTLLLCNTYLRLVGVIRIRRRRCCQVGYLRTNHTPLLHQTDVFFGIQF